jgi:hypothetical protein
VIQNVAADIYRPSVFTGLLAEVHPRFWSTPRPKIEKDLI